MKIPIVIKCEKCGKDTRVFMDLNAHSVDWSCESCGHALPGVSTSYLPPGQLLLERARYELKVQNDIPLSMVFSAAAADCELSRLHVKWSRIAAYETLHDITNEELEKEVRSYGRVKDKMEGVAKMMHPAGLTDFVKNQSDIFDRVDIDFPSLKFDRLADSITEALFWPRNRILHLGETDYDVEAGRRSFNVATLVVHIYQRMDEVKRIQSE